MSNDTRTVTGVAELCALPPVDKWHILEALGAAAESFELNHRTLAVLRALISFLPQREIHAERNSTIVFPSNRSLSERLHGMPESTLRRHLARLVELGVVSRHDSGNRKRFARRGASVAYGFDLSPLAVHADHIAKTARAAQSQADDCRSLRDEIASLRRQLLEHGLAADDDELLSCRQQLRRKLMPQQLQTLRDQLTRRLASLASGNEITTKLSAPNSQNERHIQTESKSVSDSEAKAPAPTQTRSKTETPATASPPPPALAEVLGSCNEYRSYFPDPPRSWSDLRSMVNRLVPMIGIEAPVYWQAERAMGPETAASTVLCMLERLPQIRNPGGYLRRLSQRAETGRFSLTPMLQALRNPEKLSADNFHPIAMHGTTADYRTALPVA